jgi:16S rRNA A1518/A1519 N6-dimethyltransferase RsmA/KsgA/DIM1 with predicted DNA glycosylase/AP lyase activity
LFSQRRRTLKKALETYSKVRKVNFEDVVRVIDRRLMDLRVFEIQPSDFIRINEALKEMNNS